MLPSPPPKPPPASVVDVLELSVGSDDPKRSPSAEPRSPPVFPVSKPGGVPAAPESPSLAEELEPGGGVLMLKSNVCRLLLSAELCWDGWRQTRRRTRNVSIQSKGVELQVMVTVDCFWNDRMNSTKN